MVEVTYQMVVEEKSLGEVDISDVAVAGLIGMVAPGMATAALRTGKAGTLVAKNTKAIEKLKNQSARTANRAAKQEQRIKQKAEQSSEAVKDAVATSVEAAAGVIAKNVIQDGVNKAQEHGQQAQDKQEGPKTEPPPPPPLLKGELMR